MFQQTRNWLAKRTGRNNLTLDRDIGVVSFSFDDAMHSACETGRKILEQHGCRGTWYIAGALTDGVENGHRYHSVNDIQELARAGHHVGCHTFSHLPCNHMTGTEMVRDLERNVEFFRQIGMPHAELHFSFPFGAFNKTSKRLVSTRFKSSRIVGGGIQVGSADLSGLRSEPLYQHLMTPERLRLLAKEVAAKRGWLIFHTHDIEDKPSQWGCTESLFDCAISATQDAGCKILPVDQAVQYWEAKA